MRVPGKAPGDVRGLDRGPGAAMHDPGDTARPLARAADAPAVRIRRSRTSRRGGHAGRAEQRRVDEADRGRAPAPAPPGAGARARGGAWSRSRRLDLDLEQERRRTGRRVAQARRGAGDGVMPAVAAEKRRQRLAPSRPTTSESRPPSPRSSDARTRGQTGRPVPAVEKALPSSDSRGAVEDGAAPDDPEMPTRPSPGWLGVNVEGDLPHARSARRRRGRARDRETGSSRESGASGPRTGCAPFRRRSARCSRPPTRPGRSPPVRSPVKSARLPPAERAAGAPRRDRSRPGHSTSPPASSSVCRSPLRRRPVRAAGDRGSAWLSVRAAREGPPRTPRPVGSASGPGQRSGTPSSSCMASALRARARRAAGPAVGGRRDSEA